MGPRRTTAVLGVLGLGLLTGLGVSPPAQAAGPPVTAPDVASVLQGNITSVFPLKNDQDPDNDLLTICRLGTEIVDGIDVSYLGDEVDFGVSEKVAPGAYTFTYYTCDFTTLVPGTITLTVQDLPDLKVTTAGRGRIKVKNPFTFKIRFSYGSFKAGGPDGQVRIKPGDKVKLKVKRSKVDWVCDAKKGTLYCGSGHVKNIKLRAAAPAPG